MAFVEPGLVQVDAWRPDGTEPPKSPDYHNPLYAGAPVHRHLGLRPAG
jgi:hypothetical protein